MTDVFDVYSESCDDGIRTEFTVIATVIAPARLQAIAGNGTKEGDEECDVSDGVGRIRNVRINVRS